MVGISSQNHLFGVSRNDSRGVLPRVSDVGFLGILLSAATPRFNDLVERDVYPPGDTASHDASNSARLERGEV